MSPLSVYARSECPLAASHRFVCAQQTTAPVVSNPTSVHDAQIQTFHALLGTFDTGRSGSCTSYNW